MKRIFLIVWPFLFFVGCATTSMKTKQDLKNFLVQGNFSTALNLVKSKKYYPHKRSRLLKLVELGTVNFLGCNYYQSLQSFDQARDLSDKLFTVSISKKALSAIANSNVDNYYGDRHERSLIRFYQAMNHFMIYQTGIYEAHKKLQKNKDGKDVWTEFKEKRLSSKMRQTHLSSARASILEWDSLLGNYRSLRGGKSVYKDDLSAKIFGAFIHEQIGSRNDLQVAQNLYEKAKTVLFRNYNTYPAFNTKSDLFRKNFSKFPKMGEKAIKQKYVNSTPFYKELEIFLDERILALKKKKKIPNVSVIVANGFIAPKRPRKIDFPIAFTGSAAMGSDLVGFTMGTLSLTNGSRPSITFELPEVPKKRTKYGMELIVKDTAGKMIKKTPLVIINPLSDVAFEALDENIAGTYTKIGARLVTKHIAAIMAAYTAYRTAKKQMPEFAAKVIGAGTYAAANKGIAASEKADVRQWMTLPHDFRMRSLNLPKGEYQFFVNQTSGKAVLRTTSLGNVRIDNTEGTKLLNFRVY